MHEREKIVTADSEAAALEIATNELAVPAENIRLTAYKGGRFRAQVINADAEIAVEIAKDGMKATISAYAPPVGEGVPLTQDSLREQLEAAGIAVPSDDDVTAQMFERLAKDKNIVSLVIATREPAQAGLPELENQIHYGGSPRATIWRPTADSNACA